MENHELALDKINKIRNEIIEKYSFEKMINQYFREMKLEIEY